jgi:2-hydroxychromene-2-carboxylate isomerase
VSSVEAVFYYDLGSPACYLVAERISSSLPTVPEWEPVHGASFLTVASDTDRAVIERLAAERHLQPVRWPSQWPPDSATAMLAATYAKHIGRAVSFSLAAFRQVFAGGRDLGDGDTVLLAAAACEMHPAAVLKGIELRSTQQRLGQAIERARQAGVRSLPAIVVGARVFEGDAAVEQAAAEIGARL